MPGGDRATGEHTDHGAVTSAPGEARGTPPPTGRAGLVRGLGPAPSPQSNQHRGSHCHAGDPSSQEEDAPEICIGPHLVAYRPATGDICQECTEPKCRQRPHHHGAGDYPYRDSCPRHRAGRLLPTEERPGEAQRSNRLTRGLRLESDRFLGTPTTGENRLALDDRGAWRQESRR
jgi:hypothetical protein